ncbi:MAG: peptidyl-prolyl cis-trans isomerase [Polymorphobacter sp.]
MTKLLRDPLAIFLAVGGLLFLGYWALGRSDRQIIVSAQVQQNLAADYQLMTGRIPTKDQQQKLVDDYVADEILFREAVARGMHLTDRTTRARLVDRLRFLIAGAPKTPTEAELLDFYSEHAELYRAEPQISLAHVFFTKMPEAPDAILAALNRGDRIDGDDFWMGRAFPNYGESMLRGMFGADVLKAAQTAAPGAWVGPYPSARGVHFIRVEARNPPTLMRYTDVRDQVMLDMMAAQSGGAVDAAVRTMAAKYDVDVEA